MKRKKKMMIAAALVLILGTSAGIWYQQSHVFVEGDAYRKSSETLDLRGSEISIEYYETLSQALPECDILWDIPFQGQFYPEDTRELTVNNLSARDVSQLPYFPALTTLDAVGCTDYETLMQAKDAYPGLEILYSVCIAGRDYPQDAEELSITSLSDQDIQQIRYLPLVKSVKASGCDLSQLKKLQETYPEILTAYSVPIGGENYDRTVTSLSLDVTSLSDLADALWHLPELEAVTLTEPRGTPEELISLTESYPDVSFTWTKDILGISVNSTDLEVDLSGTAPESLEQIAQEMAWFPAAEKLILCDFPYDNETMAAFREKMRPEYTVVWNVEVGYLTVRTDETYYMPGKYNLGVTEEQAYNLRYCEDMVCIDVGHKPLFTCEWAAFMPNLKYLIIADTMISDISPLEGLDQLIYLEMFITKVTDLSPLLTCTALEDLNLCYTHADPEPITQMTWLKNLWWAEPPMEEAEFQEYLPDTHLMFLHHSSTGNGWRQLQNYYDMRDYLGMHYMWG